MKKDIVTKDLELEKSKNILSKKDEELIRIYKSIGNVSSCESETKSNQTLKQIQNKISPAISSFTNLKCSDFKTVLNHPFYK